MRSLRWQGSSADAEVRPVVVSPRWRPHWTAILLLVGIGQLLFYHHSLFSGFDRVPGDYMTHLLVNFILEHDYLWMIGRADHLRLWSPPAYYPAPNVLAYSETLLGVAPIYSLFRGAGLSLDHAYSAWLFVLPILNYTAAYLLLRGGLGYAALPAAFGSFFCAYAGVLAAQVNNPQLLTLFYSYLAWYGICRLLRSRGQAAGWVYFTTLALVAQMFACLYLGWFAAVGIFVVACIALLGPHRAVVTLTLRRSAPALIAGTVLAGLALYPLVGHYLAVVGELGWSSDASEPALAEWRSWLYTGRRSLVYFWAGRSGLFAGLPHEMGQRLGVGLCTALLAAFGLWKGRDQPRAHIALLAGISLPLLITELPGGFSGWQLVAPAIPGAGGIRFVSRFGVFLVLPLAIGLAEWSSRARWGAGMIGIALLAIAEQGYSEYTFSLQQTRSVVEWLSRDVRADCQASYTVIAQGSNAMPHWVYGAEAMIAQLRTAVPTVNGGAYTRWEPAGYGRLGRNVFSHPREAQELRRDLQRWQRRHKLAADSVCWVQLDSSQRPQ